jgi:hypothetical protein
MKRKVYGRRGWGIPVSTTLNDVAWKTGDAEQNRLRLAAMKCIGTIAGGDPSRSENAGSVRQRHAAASVPVTR